MQLKVSDVASDVWEDIVNYYLSNYGTQAILSLTDTFEAKTNHFLKYPEAGSLVIVSDKGLQHLYRSFHISKHLKVVYYIDAVDESMKIVDIWDTRMMPDKLEKRLRKKHNY